MKLTQLESSLAYVREFGCYLRTALSMAEDEAGRDLTSEQIDAIAAELHRTGRIDNECTMQAEDSFSRAFRLAFDALGVKGIVGNQTGRIDFDGKRAQLSVWAGGGMKWNHTALCYPARDGSGDHWTHGNALLEQVWDPYGWPGRRTGLKRATLYTFWRST